MKKLFYLLLLGLIPLIIFPVFAQEEESEILPWVKIIAGSWWKGEISDNTFKSAMESLIENNIIEIQNPINMALAETPIQIVNMQKIIDDLQIQNDAIEESKDVLEEEFYKEKSEYLKNSEEELENTRLNLTKYYEDKITEIIKETDASRDKAADEYREFSVKWDTLWDEYNRLYNTINEVKENTNPNDFK